MTGKIMTPYIVCCGTNGRAVIFGYAASQPVTGSPIHLEQARMVLYWSKECGGLFGLAQKGPQTGTRLTCAVDVTATDAVQQWVSVSPAAAKGIGEWPAV